MVGGAGERSGSGDGRAIARVLTVPGWTGSGPDHWQTLWERTDPSCHRVEMPDWDRPDPDEWVAALDAALDAAAVPAGEPPVLAAHSLGCLGVVRWAAGETAGRARAALLVAPPDAEREDAPPEIAGFAPIPIGQLPFTTIVVASRTDPWIDFDRAGELARAWGAELVDAGDAGTSTPTRGSGRGRGGKPCWPA